MRRRLLLILGILISIALLALAVRGLHLQEFLADLSQANLFWLLPGIGAYFVAVFVRAIRWKFLLKPNRDIAAPRLFPIVVIGYMGNNIYPARIGELVRAYVLRRKFGVPIAFTLSTILLERLMDAVVMLGFVLIGLPRAAGLSDQVRSALGVAGVLFGLATLVFFGFALAPRAAARIAEAVINRIIPARFAPKLVGMVERFVEGAQSLKNPLDLAGLVGTSITVWLIETVKYWCIAQGFGMSTSYPDLMLVNGISNLFTILPGLPGAAGTFDSGSILALEALGVTQALATAYTVVLHVALWLPVTALGAYFMLREGLKWNDLRAAEHAAAEPEQPTKN
ncbi:MAG: flippase-like domain-containing protein [Thermoflexales bacterium]|nr:flippase-like domain-containing protein [Thermoflexales bacterium]